MLFGIIAFLVLSTAFCIVINIKNSDYKTAVSLINESDGIIGSIYSFPYEKNGKTEFIVKVIAVKNKKITDYIKIKPFKILLKCENNNSTIKCGDIICVENPIKLPVERIYDFNYRDYLLNKGIYGKIDAGYDRLKLISKIKKPFYVNILSNTIWSIREAIIKKLKSSFSKEVYGFIVSIIFGIRSELDNDIYNQFKNTGLMHLLAISGLHIAGVAFLFFKSFNIFLSKSKSGILTGIIIAIFVSMMLQSASCDRAFYMYIFALLFFITGLNIPIFNVLCMTYCLLIFINPYSIFDAGFQFSFLATTGIILLNNHFEEKMLPALPKFIKSAISVSLSSFLSVAFLQIALFKRIQLFSIISSIFIVPTFTLLFYVAFFSTIILFFTDLPFLISLTEFSVSIFLKIIELLNHIPILNIQNVPAIAGYLALPFMIFYFYIINPYISKKFTVLKLKKIFSRDELKKAA
jgi:competence protein ComEC